MKTKALLAATTLGFALVVSTVNATGTHLQIQNDPVTRNRPGTAERCVYFDPRTAHIGQFTDRRSVELVVAPLRTLSRFESQDDAARLLRIVKRFGIDELCTSANSKLAYMLVSGKAPKGKVPGEKYVTFDPRGLMVRQVAGEWRLLDGESPLFAFGPDESAARQALRVIKYYGFNAKCSIGGGKGFVFLCTLPNERTKEKKPALEARAAPGP